MEVYFSSQKYFKWFDNNQIKSDSHKYYTLILSKTEIAKIQIGEHLFKSNNNKNLLSFNIGNNLHFDIYVNHLCSKANKKGSQHLSFNIFW